MCSLINKALADARVEPEQVNYVNAHASGLVQGDMLEAMALQRVFPRSHWPNLKINATKSLIGHAQVTIQ